MKKKLLVVSMLLCLVMSLCACGSDTSETSSQEAETEAVKATVVGEWECQGNTDRLDNADDYVNAETEGMPDGTAQILTLNEDQTLTFEIYNDDQVAATFSGTWEESDGKLVADYDGSTVTYDVNSDKTILAEQASEEAKEALGDLVTIYKKK